MNRRGFLQTMLVAGGAAVTGPVARATTARPSDSETEFLGVLVDTTKCVGCRTCEWECAQANGLPEPDIDDYTVLDKRRNTSVDQFSVINRFEVGQEDVFAKQQCMHCNQPACASACLVKAMYKTKEGPVIWRGDKCMGCRFCMVSCPFDIPKFEYHSTHPRIRKCIMCWGRLEKGKQPACVEGCPESALKFGPRRELLDVARERIAKSTDAYVHHIYGEHEAGGTGFLYLSAVPFEKLHFRKDIENIAYPELSKGFLYSVPLVLALVPPFLAAINNATCREDSHDEG